MSEAKHTPGPWVKRKFPTGRGGIPVWWILDSIPDRDGQVIANAICYTAGTNDDADANATLLEAAPDLLAACEALIEMADAWDRHFSEHAKASRWTDSDPDIMAQARAAVAKAKGGQP